MNTDQTASLVRSLLKIIGTFLLAHGLTNAANIVNGEDFAGIALTVIGLVMSHFNHTSTTTTPPASSGRPPLMLIPFLALALFASGCASTPQKTAYNVTGTTIVSVDTAMNLWGAYVAANQPGTNVELQVENAFNKYQAAMVVVTDAGAAYSATSGTNSTAIAGFSQAESVAAQDLTDLENLLISLGVKL